jgi:cytochrome o ubiquinol oxidase subunit 2
MGFQKYIDVLFPQGEIAWRQLHLLLLLQAIMLIVVLPIFVMAYVIFWKYSANRNKGEYDPNFNDSWIAELVWWGLPCIIVGALSVVTWYETHALDPYKPIASDKETVNIQAVALQWNWLFIYPDDGVASLNYLQIPVGRPIHFEITADAPMNSFWIPALGGQIYAMPSMKTQLYLIADEPGEYRGSSANISGKGFSDMWFMTRGTSEEEYQAWLNQAKAQGEKLSWTEYKKIAEPTLRVPESQYQLTDNKLFQKIIDKFMQPQKNG